VTSDDLLGEAVEELYSADPEEFTRRRGELAARARAAGQTAVARQIAGLRKPMRSAWMINQLVRSDPGIAARLAELGEELRAIERSGDGSRMREASQARRQLIATLVPQALARSGQHPPPAALREEITATFSAALADPEVAEQIQRATLLRPARRAGFGTAQGPALALVPPLPSGDTTNANSERSSVNTTNANSERNRRQVSAKAEQARGDAKQHRQADAKRDRRADAKRNQQAKAERDRQAEAEAERARGEAEAEQARAKAEAERARAEAERALADAEGAEQAARRAQQDREEAVRRLEQELRDVRSQLHEARAQARQAEIARRRARQVLGRLPE
jgi:hypothetical protein